MASCVASSTTSGATPRWPATAVVALLARLVAVHGRPIFIRSDAGPEFVADVLAHWAAAEGITLVRSAPEARALAAAYREWYDTEPGHSALGYQTPEAFAAKMT